MLFRSPGVITGSTTPCKTSTAVPYTISAVSTPAAPITSYTWSVVGGGTISGTSTTGTANFTTTTSSASTVKVVANNACGASSAASLAVTVNMACRGAQPQDETMVKAFPNPTNGKVTVNFNAPSADRYAVRLFDLLGNTIMNVDVDAVEGLNIKELDLTKVAKGIYLLNVQGKIGRAHV